MSNLVERLKLERRRETVLSTGRKVGYHLPDIEECILKLGQVPMPAIARLAQQGKKKPTPEEAAKLIADHPEAIDRGMEFVRVVVAAMLDDIDGEVIDETDDRTEIVNLLGPSERQELFVIGTRDEDPDSGEA